MTRKRSNGRSLMVASVMAAAGTLVASQPASACSGPPLTFDAAISGSELIVEGTVEEVMLDGLAFRLAVKEVFKGAAGGPEVRIGPTDSEGRGCEVGLQVGQHVVLGIVDIQAQLNSLATAVWFVAADGSLSSPGSLWEVATDIDDLRAKLRQAVPDTALPVKPQGAPAGTALTVLGLVSLVLASAAAPPSPARGTPWTTFATSLRCRAGSCRRLRVSLPAPASSDRPRRAAQARHAVPFRSTRSVVAVLVNGESRTPPRFAVSTAQVRR